MGWSLITWLAVGVGAIGLFFVGQIVYLGVVLAQDERNRSGLSYYGLPPQSREDYKRKLRGQARRLRPITRLMGRLSGFTFERASFEHSGVRAPLGTCTEESFREGTTYEAGPRDVFVATQMKCGTTWMQHVVYEVLRRGDGDLVDTGTALYAVSPWLEAVTSVPVEEAPLIGSERPSRVIKTHLSTSLCPLSTESRYIYVARHPVSCFASCVDFIATNTGPLNPELGSVEDWYCSDGMWFGSWPTHVSGWWELSEGQDNVLFVQFEEMKRDLPGVVRRVAEFMGVEILTETELGRVVEKCGFEYMQANKGAFEMHPPHLFATDAEHFVRGTVDRHKDVPDEVRRRVYAWCETRMSEGELPLDRLYPE